MLTLVLQSHHHRVIYGYMKNTLKQGVVRTIIFKEADTWYAVGLEFNIVSSGDTAEVAAFTLDQAIKGYVTSLNNTKIGGFRPEVVLNQEVDPEYEALWKKLEKNEPISSPFQVHSFGRTLISA